MTEPFKDHSVYSSYYFDSNQNQFDSEYSPSSGLIPGYVLLRQKPFPASLHQQEPINTSYIYKPDSSGTAEADSYSSQAANYISAAANADLFISASANSNTYTYTYTSAPDSYTSAPDSYTSVPNSYTSAQDASYTSAQDASYTSAQDASYTSAQDASYTSAQDASYTSAQDASYSSAQDASYSSAQDASYSSAQDALYSSAQDASYSSAQDASYSSAQDASYSSAQDALYSSAQDASYSSAQDASYSSAQDASYSSAQDTSYSSAQDASYSSAQDALYSSAQDASYSSAQDVSYSSAQDFLYSSAQDFLYSSAQDFLYSSAQDASTSAPDSYSYTCSTADTDSTDPYPSQAAKTNPYPYPNISPTIFSSPTATADSYVSSTATPMPTPYIQTSEAAKAKPYYSQLSSESYSPDAQEVDSSGTSKTCLSCMAEPKSHPSYLPMPDSNETKLPSLETTLDSGIIPSASPLPTSKPNIIISQADNFLHHCQNFLNLDHDLDYYKGSSGKRGHIIQIFLDWQKTTQLITKVFGYEGGGNLSKYIITYENGTGSAETILQVVGLYLGWKPRNYAQKCQAFEWVLLVTNHCLWNSNETPLQSGWFTFFALLAFINY
ncbi:hypothetical protein C8R42DRAFT_760628 [Lentinula raphanica]|nr:hypothetical protein C8R42DRAFT_760628 [Lentinula raphanica]